MVAPGGGMHGCSVRACVVAPGGGMHGCSGGGMHAWLLTGACMGYDKIWNTINERAVHILLECILVL